MKSVDSSFGRQDTMTHPQQPLRDRKLTTWQENFARYIYMQTGYVPDLESLKLAMLLQKQYRTSPWNQSRLHGVDVPKELPELPYEIEHIEIHGKIREPEQKAAALVADPAPVVETIEEPKIRDVADWAKVKADLGEAFPYIAAKPFTTTFTPEPEPEPLPEEVAKRTERRINAAKLKAGRRKS